MNDDPSELIVKKKVGPLPVPKEHQSQQYNATLGFWRTFLQGVKSISKIKFLGLEIERRSDGIFGDQTALAKAQLEFEKTEQERVKTALLREELRAKRLANDEAELIKEKEQQKLEAILRLEQALRMLRLQGGELFVDEEKILKNAQNNSPDKSIQETRKQPTGVPSGKEQKLR